MLTADPPTRIEPARTPRLEAVEAAGLSAPRMPVIRSVFWRIFLWFWLAMIVLAAAVTFTVYLTDPDQFFPRLHSVPLRQIDQLGRESVARYESGGASALRTFLTDALHGAGFGEQTPQSYFDGVYLFDLQTGRELSGQKPPAGAEAVVRRTRDNSDLQLERLLDKMLMARSVASAAGDAGNGAHYAFMLSMPRTSLLLPTTGQLWLDLAAALITSGLVCYWLAQYVIAPVRNLQCAARRLAGGDLSVRVSTSRALAHRHDEFSELASDFDEMAARIENLLTAQRQLIGDISHELGSPLTRMNVALRIAYRKAGEEVRPELERIERESNRLNDLIRQLLLLSELENREQVLIMERVDLLELVREVAADAEFEASNRRCRVCVNPLPEIGSENWTDGNAPGLAFTKGSRHLLRSAVENVVRNAVRYTAEDSEVTIEIGKKGGAPSHPPRMVIRVRDHGPGVPPAALANLFRPFYRVSEARDRLSGGTGLGLAITRQAVQAHAGTVSAMNHPAGGFLVEIELNTLA